MSDCVAIAYCCLKVGLESDVLSRYSSRWMRVDWAQWILQFAEFTAWTFPYNFSQLIFSSCIGYWYDVLQRKTSYHGTASAERWKPPPTSAAPATAAAAADEARSPLRRRYFVPSFNQRVACSQWLSVHSVYCSCYPVVCFTRAVFLAFIITDMRNDPSEVLCFYGLAAATDSKLCRVTPWQLSSASPFLSNNSRVNFALPVVAFYLYI